MMMTMSSMIMINVIVINKTIIIYRYIHFLFINRTTIHFF